MNSEQLYATLYRFIVSDDRCITVRLKSTENNMLIYQMIDYKTFYCSLLYCPYTDYWKQIYPMSINIGPVENLKELLDYAHQRNL